MKVMYWIIASAVTVAGLATMAVGATQMKKDNKVGYVSRTEQFESIRHLDFNTGAEELRLVASEEAKIVTVELKNVPESLTVTKDGDTLHINHQQTMSFFTFETPSSEIIVTVPAEELGKVVLDGGSGNLSVEQVQAETFFVENGSGSVSVKDVRAGEGKIHTGSGDMYLENATFTELPQLQSGSGSMNGSGLTVENNLTISAGSGAVTINQLTAGGIKADSGSADVELTNLTLTGDGRFEAGSGDVELLICGDPADYIVSGNSGSGGTMFEGVGGKKNDNAVNVTVMTGSGDASVRFGTSDAETTEAE